MIVPSYWSEASQQFRRRGKLITVRRFGWSVDSEDAAKQHAEQRVADAVARIERGELLPKREPKVAYNGAEGVPIREEVIARHDDVVITRNSYGARCLNVPDVAFVDIDDDVSPSRAMRFGSLAVLMLFVVILAITVLTPLQAIGVALIAWLLSYVLAEIALKINIAVRGGKWAMIRQRVAAFSTAHPHWHLRLYKTYAGARVLIMHQTFDPRSADMQACFAALASDPMYQLMCQKQHCFRARISAKPWRIGVTSHLRPRPGVWPIAEQHREARTHWINTYETQARQYKVCEFVEQLGSQNITSKTRNVQQLHDELCRVSSTLALA